MGRVLGIALAAFFLSSAAAAASSISGTYVGIGQDAVGMLQLVETGDGKLNGHYEQIRLMPGPKLDVVNATVSGHTDEKMVTLNINRIGSAAEQFVLSGSFSGGVLTLTGGTNGQAITVHLSSNTADSFNAASSALSKKAELMKEALDIDASKTRLEAILQRMTAFNTRADRQAKTLPASEERLKQLTHRMENALARQQSIPPIDRTAVFRGQIGVAINHAGVESSQYHVDLQSKQAEFRKDSVSLISEAGSLIAKCQNSTEGLEAFTSSIPAWQDACAKANGVVSEFKIKTDNIMKAFDHAEAVWQVENRSQQSIIRSADIASR